MNTIIITATSSNQYNNLDGIILQSAICNNDGIAIITKLPFCLNKKLVERTYFVTNVRHSRIIQVKEHLGVYAIKKKNK